MSVRYIRAGLGGWWELVQAGAKSRIGPVAALLLGAVAAAGLPAAGADEGDTPTVPLERLLRLPTSAPVQGRVEKRGGGTKSQWQARFRAAREDLEAARRALGETRTQLEELAGGEAWTMSAPGLGGPLPPTESPLDYKLSQELKRRREEVERAERNLRDLEVEANLAGVPEDWRDADAAPTEAAPPEVDD